MKPESSTPAILLTLPRVPRSRRRGQITALLLLGVPAVFLVRSFFTQPNYQWSVVWDYMFDPTILKGLKLTLWLTFLSMLIGIIVGTALAAMTSSSNGQARGAAKVYIWLFRGTPTLVQILFWYNLAALFPTIGVGQMSFDVNTVITPVVAACLGLGLSEAAYTAEIIRGGIVSVDSGQVEAAKALGLNGGRVMRRIVLPQALPSVIPPLGNEFIGMLKYSSLASTIAVTELLGSAQLIYSINFETIPLLIVVVIWYLVLTSIFTLLQGRVEKWISRSQANAAHPTGRRQRAGGVA